jgi:hypothetical protein
LPLTLMYWTMFMGCLVSSVYLRRNKTKLLSLPDLFRQSMFDAGGLSCGARRAPRWLHSSLSMDCRNKSGNDKKYGIEKLLKTVISQIHS